MSNSDDLFEGYDFNEKEKRLEPHEKLCVYCSNNYSDGNTTNHIQSIYKELDRTNIVVYRSVKYNKLDVGIPRCVSCKKIHDTAESNALIICFMLALVSIILGFMIWGLYGVLAFVIAPALSVLLYFYLKRYFVEHKGLQTPSDGSLQVELIKRFTKNGWSITKPDA